MNNLIEEFLIDIKNNGIQMNHENILTLLEDVKNIITKNKDCTKEEMVESIIQQFTQDTAHILNDRNLIPGYNIALQVGNIQVQIMDGYTNYQELKQIDEQSLFDIASCSKLFTQIIAYNLIKENIFSFSTKISDIDPRFTNLKDLTIKDITRFNVSLNTDKRIDLLQTKEEAYDVLFNTQVLTKDKYNYNDIGMIILKEVMENITNKNYETLLNEYIFSKLNLNDTFVNLPKDRYPNLTGTPNNKLGLINDPKAIVLGGYSGHAGIISNAKDLLTLASNLLGSESISPYQEHLYTPGISEIRGIMGNTYTYHKNGLNSSFVSNNEPKKTFRVQGSTRTSFGTSKFVLKKESYITSNTILLNPSSMNPEYAKKLQDETNKKDLEQWLKKDPQNNNENNFKPTNVSRNFKTNNQEYTSIDPRKIVSIGKTTDPITEKIAVLNLKLMFLETVLQNYETTNEKHKNVAIKYYKTNRS